MSDTLHNLEIHEDGEVDLIPSVNFNAETGEFWLSGYSMLENSRSFYAKIHEWLDNYILLKNHPVTFNIKMRYFNTASSQQILFTIKKMQKFIDKGGEVIINWYHMDDDLDMIEEGEDFAADAKLDFNFISYPTEAL